MKSPIPQRLNVSTCPSVIPLTPGLQGASPCLISCHTDLANSFQVLKTGRREPGGYLAGTITTKTNGSKQQLVSINGDTVRCDSIEMDEALACDVTTGINTVNKPLCVHIRENKWYDAANAVSTGTSLNNALKSISLAYNPTTKQLYSINDEKTDDNYRDKTDSVDLESHSDRSANIISKIDADIGKNDVPSLNNSPRSSLPRSCSSTVSSLSEVSPSGSLLGPDDQPISPQKPKRWPLGVFFTKNVFSWKQKDTQQQNCTPSGSPSRNVDKIGGSSALIPEQRPSNLPAKSAMEEENHRKQYNAILEAAKRRELKEEKERKLQRELQLKEEERLAEDSLLWNNQILPKFHHLKDTKRVKDLWWRGLPPSIRGRVWKLAIFNQLNITPHLYNICLDRALSNQTNDCLTSIKLDVSRTFPTLCVFKEGGPLAKSLQGVLAAYAVYRPDVGYVQGMSFLGAVLSLNMEPVDVFTCFANLLNRPCHRAAFTLDQKQMSVYYKVYTNALAYRLPKIHAHFTAAGLSPDLYLLDWLYTVYAKAMPLDVASRIWDVFLRDGDEFLFRTALGVLHLHQDELLGMDFVRGAQFLTRLPDNLQAESLFHSINQMSTTIGTSTFHQMIAQIS